VIELQTQIVFDEVIAGMLSAQCFGGKSLPRTVSVPASSEARYQELVDRGYLFLRFLPQCDWYNARLASPDDLGRLRLIAEESWFSEASAADRWLATWAALDTLPDSHCQRVRRLLSEGLQVECMQRRITLFGRSPEGPFTILDGNHRMLALAHNVLAQRMPMEPLDVHLGLSFGPCRWHGDPVMWEERPPHDGKTRFVLRTW